MSPDDPDPSNDIEDAIIGMFRRGTGSEPMAGVHVGIGDDACVLHDGTAWTCDTLVEHVHWDQRLSLGDVGFKAIAASASDLGAMGASPQWALVALALPPVVDIQDVEALATGFHEAATRWGIQIVGGDTTRSSGPTVITVTMGGQLHAQPMLRSGGHAGDDLWVTGYLGRAAGGYLDTTPSEASLDALRRPDPPIAFALHLANQGLASAAMDISDGLASDVPRLCRASGVGATIDPGQLPTHACLTNREDARQRKLCGGEDYELLFASPRRHRDAIVALAKSSGVVASRVGSLTADRTVHVAGGGWPRPVYQHFRAAQ